MLINCEIACENDGMNHILKYIKNICTAQENPVSDPKTKTLKISKNLKKKRMLIRPSQIMVMLGW